MRHKYTARDTGIVCKFTVHQEYKHKRVVHTAHEITEFYIDEFEMLQGLSRTITESGNVYLVYYHDHERVAMLKLNSELAEVKREDP